MSQHQASDLPRTGTGKMWPFCDVCIVKPRIICTDCAWSSSINTGIYKIKAQMVTVLQKLSVACIIWPFIKRYCPRLTYKLTVKLSNIYFAARSRNIWRFWAWVWRCLWIWRCVYVWGQFVQLNFNKESMRGNYTLPCQICIKHDVCTVFNR